jgi:hypothetical protein
LNYSAALPTLRKFNKILVSGPQRSGTTIAAKMIAKDLGITFFDETRIKSWDKDDTINIIRYHPRFVLQCPGLCAWLHVLGAFPDVLIVMMRRDIVDIIESERRINWQWAYAEYEQYKKAFKDKAELWEPISAYKYIVWEEVQRDQVKNYIELEYESLSDHPLWVPKEKRLGFEYKQTVEK